MLYNKKEKIAIAVLLALSLATHFAWFGYPDMTVFDEVHFGKFLSAYFTHAYYFDIHPPLGKLILAGWGWLWGFQPGFSFSNIGDVFPDNTYMALRFLPSLAGSLLPLVIYFIARKLKMGWPAALAAGLFVALDNALVVQSRLILLDSFLLLFGFGAVLCWLNSRDKPNRYPWLLAAGGLGLRPDGGGVSGFAGDVDEDVGARDVRQERQRLSHPAQVAPVVLVEVRERFAQLVHGCLHRRQPEAPSRLAPAPRPIALAPDIRLITTDFAPTHRAIPEL